MDKTYTAFQSLHYKFLEFAEENNFFSRLDVLEEDLFIELKYTEFENYPYVDTFHLMDGNKLTNRPVEYEKFIDGGIYKSFDCTNGSCTTHKGHKYFIDINSEDVKYTFDYLSLQNCSVDGRLYKSTDIDPNRVHKEYNILSKNKLFHFNNMLEFSPNSPITKLFIHSLENELKIGSSRFIDNKMSAYEYDDGIFQHIGDVNVNFPDKRNREIILPIQVGKSIDKPMWGGSLEYQGFMKIKLMPSGFRANILSVNKKDISKSFEFEPGTIIEKSIGESYYQIDTKNYKDLVSNKFPELKSDLLRFFI